MSYAKRAWSQYSAIGSMVAVMHIVLKKLSNNKQQSDNG